MNLGVYIVHICVRTLGIFEQYEIFFFFLVFHISEPLLLRKEFNFNFLYKYTSLKV